jgi:PAS domain S-box-containing protein
MNETDLKPLRPLRLQRYRWAVAVAWTCLVGLLLFVDLSNEQRQVKEIALSTARTMYRRDSHWAMTLGEIYVPLTEEAETILRSGNLPVSTVSTSNGDRLVMMSPASIVKSIESSVGGETGVKARMTSLAPTRAENAPDGWEEQALQQFDRGVDEVSEMQAIDNRPTLRFIGALKTGPSCMRCHETQGYRLGQIRGGISITIPMEPLYAGANVHIGTSILSYCLFWVLGLGGTVLGGRRLRQQITERDAATEARLRAESQFRKIWEKSFEGMRIIDGNGTILMVNDAYCRMVAKEKEDLEGKPLTTVYAEELHSTGLAQIQQRFAEGIFQPNLSLELPLWDGRMLSLERSDAFLDSEDGSRQLLSIFRNLTDRRRTEAALEETRERYRRIVETTREGIWELDAEALTTFVNRPMAEMLGYTVEEMIGRSMYDFMDDRARAEALRNFQRRKEYLAEQHDFRFRRKDGSDLWAILSTNPIFDREGRFAGALAMVTDITSRKAVEEDLRQSEERLRMVIESTDDIILMQDLDGKFLYCNPGRRYGVDGADVVGKHPSDFLDEDSTARIMDGIREVTSLKKRKTVEEKVHLQEEFIWFLAQRSPVFDEAGNVKAVTTFSRNITMLKHLQEELRGSEERLKLEKMRTRIAADLHDDIGSTLSSIVLFNEMLRQEIAGDSKKAVQLVERVGENLRSVQESLDEIVWSIDPENDSLDDILIRMQEHAAELLEGRNIGFSVDAPDEPLGINLPMEKRRQLYMIFKEAVNNLLKHSECRDASLIACVEGRQLLLSISDNGKGFRTGNGNRGNGLANMRARATTLGGSLVIGSTEGVGTTVTLRVPVA